MAEKESPPGYDDAPDKTILALMDECEKVYAEIVELGRRCEGIESVTVLRYHVSTESAPRSLTLSVKETRPVLSGEGIRKLFALTGKYALDPIVPDLFRDNVNYKCTTFEETLATNGTMIEACRKYDFLDPKKAQPFVRKFLKNFANIKAALTDLIAYFENRESKLAEIEEEVKSINKRIASLCDTPSLFFAPLVEIELNTPSKILDAAMTETLAKMFKSYKLIKLRFLGSSQTVGVAAQNFENMAGSQGNILTVIRATSEHVFGCYLDVRLNSGGWQACGPKSFLFALGNANKTPLRFNPKLGAAQYHGGCGLHVGTGSSNAIAAFCNHTCADAGSTFTADPEYPSPNGLAAGVLCGTPGNHSFSPGIMEVYHVTFS